MWALKSAKVIETVLRTFSFKFLFVFHFCFQFCTYLEIRNFQSWKLEFTFLIKKKLVKSDFFIMAKLHSVAFICLIKQWIWVCRCSKILHYFLSILFCETPCICIFKHVLQLCLAIKMQWNKAISVFPYNSTESLFFNS